MAAIAVPLIVPVLLGSVRCDRQRIRAAHLIVATLHARGHEPVLIDPLQLPLTSLDQMYKEHPRGEAPDALERLATLYHQADGFMIVSAEYNKDISPALKNLLDYFLEDYFWRLLGIVCYSARQFGGVLAAMQLRMTLAELGMPSVPSLFPTPRISQALGEDGTPRDEKTGGALDKFLAEFCWMRAPRSVNGWRAEPIDSGMMPASSLPL